ncbi:secreted RxLR effector protein 161-like [Solanum dulcamara]|uniref:secreted RxLR effector protein 161-like n=1 Tax=Solanum dulcamara TaxID=45834 RepID=UPI0024866D5A|nr:secreted RxLR effector protein 161-like [Solanum dulcamara]
MHQRKYVLELISETGLVAAKPAVTPVDINVQLTSRQYDEHLGISNTTDPPTDQSSHQRVIGKLLYLTVTRLEIAYSVQTLSPFLQDPKKYHMEATLRIVSYLKQQPGKGVLLSSKSDLTMSAYCCDCCDADWASCPMSRKSITGYLIKLGDSLITWKSKKQTFVSRSSAES